MKKQNPGVWLDPPPIGRIKQAAAYAEWIQDVAKPSHNIAKMRMPMPKPNNNFNKITFTITF